MAKDLVAYVISRINTEWSTAINQNVAPKVLFTGLRMDYKKEFSLAFAEYCEVYNGTDNTSRARSIPCIALCPFNNEVGSWAFLNLVSKQRIRRWQWVKMITSEEIVQRMNAFDGIDEIPAAGLSTDQMEVKAREEQPAQGSIRLEEGTAKGATDGVEQAVICSHEDNECPELEDQGNEESDDEDDDGEESNSEEERPSVRRSERIKGGIAKPKKYAAATEKVGKSSKHDAETEEAVKQAKIAEIRQVFDKLEALEPVEKTKIPVNVTPLGSHLFP
jgi:hypothetical protein